MSTYWQLKQQIAELEKKAAVVMKVEAKKVIEAIKEQIAEFGLTAADLGLAIARRAGAGAAKTKKRVLPPKYHDPTTGKTWSGHGKRPSWFVAAQKKGRLDELLIGKRSLAQAAPQARASAKPARTKTQKRAAAAAKPAAKKAAKKPAVSAQRKRIAAPKALAPKPTAKKAAKPTKTQAIATKPSAQATKEPAAVSA